MKKNTYSVANYSSLLDDAVSSVLGWQTLYNSTVVRTHHGNAHAERSTAISRWLCENHRFKTWADILRSHAVKREMPGSTKGTYNVAHDCKIANPNSRRDEEHIGMALCEHCRQTRKPVPGIGLVLNYQIPLKNNDRHRPNIGTTLDENIGIGKAIDMVALKDGKLYLYEMKVQESAETMIRCLLESFTYAKSIKSLDKFKEDFKLPRATRIVISPLCFRGGVHATPYNDAIEMESNPKLAVWELVDKMRDDVKSWADIEITKVNPEDIPPVIAKWIRR